MSWVLSDKEFAAVRVLPASKRYEYLVKHAADEGVLWSLKDGDGWVLGADEHGRELHPVWPHSRYAQAGATGEWVGARPELIDLHDWLDTWTPGMRAGQRLVGVFPSDSGDEVAIEPSEFAYDLLAELERIE